MSRSVRMDYDRLRRLHQCHDCATLVDITLVFCKRCEVKPATLDGAQ